ncbi:MAG: siderophore-interacting protein [Asticcacaulis sp.]
MTDTTDPRAPMRVRHPLKFRNAEVASVTRLSEHMIRIVLRHDDLKDFVSSGFDDHVKVFFPDPQTGIIHTPTVGPDGAPVRDPNLTIIARDYTPRAFDNETGELTLDFAVHDAGPATQWAQNAKVGDVLGVGGPRGSFVIPLAFDGYVLIGDDTALPAIARRLTEIGPDAPVLVVAEVDGPESEVDLNGSANVRLHWAHRNGQKPGNPAILSDALKALQLPEGDLHVWVAAESGVARHLRGQLLETGRVNPKWLKVASYWKTGQVATHETIDDKPA